MSFRCSQCETTLSPDHPLAKKQFYHELMQGISNQGHMYTYHTVIPPFHRYVEKVGGSTQSLLGVMCQRQGQTAIRPVFILMTGLVEKVDIWMDECTFSPLSDRSTYHGDGLGCGYGDNNITAYELLNGVRDILTMKEKDPEKARLRSYGEFFFQTPNTKKLSRSIALTFQNNTILFDAGLEDITKTKNREKKTLAGEIVTVVCKYDLFQNKWFIVMLRIHPKDEVAAALTLMNKFMYGDNVVSNEQK